MRPTESSDASTLNVSSTSKSRPPPRKTQFMALGATLAFTQQQMPSRTSTEAARAAWRSPASVLSEREGSGSLRRERTPHKRSSTCEREGAQALQQSDAPQQNVCRMPPSVRMAQEVVAELGGGQVLLGSLPGCQNRKTAQGHVVEGLRPARKVAALALMRAFSSSANFS